MFYNDGDKRLIPGYVIIDKDEHSQTLRGRPTVRNDSGYDTAEQIMADYRASGYSLAMLAEKYNMTISNIKNIVYNKTWD